MIWIDLDNTPHVPFFRPILKELQERNIDTFVTSRAHAQTEDLLSMWGIPHQAVGVHGGKSSFRKVANLLHRSISLARATDDKPISLSVSHGSRSHLLASKLKHVPSVWMTDYEYSEHVLANMLATHILVPSIIPEKRLKELGFAVRKLIRYEGFKEEVYLKDFVPDVKFRKSIDVDDASILVTIRPPSITANYHDIRGEILFVKCLTHLAARPNVRCLIVNRTKAELGLIPSELRKADNVAVLDHSVDGLQLIWNSDLVISGGGTMNREGALLGVPTYSIFTGRRPSMDEHLAAKGMLTFVEVEAQIESIPFIKRTIGGVYHPKNTDLASRLTSLFIELQDEQKS